MNIILAAIVTYHGMVLDCSQWSKFPDGTWSGTNVVIMGDGIDVGIGFSGSIDNVKHGSLMQNGVDVFDALESACNSRK